MSKNVSIPWVEKYRPSSFDKIVLDQINYEILKNIIDRKHMPNLLFYGPPGTGKTTTIINLIKSYQEKVGNVDPKMMIHLNASDDRGIDVIRSQIYNFVNTKTLFNNGMKFVILDEADYMTKTAQQALHNLLENLNENIRICLICNYISKIDLSLQSEFVHMRFNKLPEKDIINFLHTIVKNEGLVAINKHTIKSIQEYYNNDIRSMINFLQINRKNKKKMTILDKNTFDEMFEIIKDSDYNRMTNKINQLVMRHKMEKHRLLKLFLKYIIYEKKEYTKDLLNILEILNHNIINNYIVDFSLRKIQNYINKKYQSTE